MISGSPKAIGKQFVDEASCCLPGAGRWRRESKVERAMGRLDGAMGRAGSSGSGAKALGLVLLARMVTTMSMKREAMRKEGSLKAGDAGGAMDGGDEGC